MIFNNTESWRLVYEQLLQSKVVTSYKSVAWIKDVTYWQDEPENKSVQLCFDLSSSQRLNMERICIVADHLWPATEKLPEPNIANWLEKHLSHGIKIKLVRESALLNDQDLIDDFGIYGSHAVGHQLIADNRGTVRFLLQFDFDAVSNAERDWERLCTYAIDFKKVRGHPP